MNVFENTAEGRGPTLILTGWLIVARFLSHLRVDFMLGITAFSELSPATGLHTFADCSFYNTWNTCSIETQSVMAISLDRGRHTDAWWQCHWFGGLVNIAVSFWLFETCKRMCRLHWAVPPTYERAMSVVWRRSRVSLAQADWLENAIRTRQVDEISEKWALVGDCSLHPMPQLDFRVEPEYRIRFFKQNWGMVYLLCKAWPGQQAFLPDRPQMHLPTQVNIAVDCSIYGGLVVYRVWRNKYSTVYGCLPAQQCILQAIQQSLRLPLLQAATLGKDLLDAYRPQ